MPTELQEHVILLRRLASAVLAVEAARAAADKLPAPAQKIKILLEQAIQRIHWARKALDTSDTA